MARRSGLETIRTAEQVAGPKLEVQKRDRSWEEKNRPLMFRLPSARERDWLQADVKRLADHYDVPVGEMAGWLLRQAINQVDAGMLTPETKPLPGKKSLVWE